MLVAVITKDTFWIPYSAYTKRVAKLASRDFVFFYKRHRTGAMRIVSPVRTRKSKTVHSVPLIGLDAPLAVRKLALGRGVVGILLVLRKRKMKK